MALKRTDNGQYVLSSKKQVKAALLLMEELKEEIAALHAEHGITEMMQDAVELKKAAEAYMEKNGISELDLGNGQYGKLVKGGYDRHWVLTDSEIDRSMKGVKSLRAILRKKFGSAGNQGYKDTMKRITKRVVDPELIEEAVSEGLLDEKEIAPAFVEKERKPYLRVYGENDE